MAISVQVDEPDEPGEAMVASPAALQVLDMSPTKVILDLGCTKAMGSRAAAASTSTDKATTPTCGMRSTLPHLSSLRQQPNFQMHREVSGLYE